MTTETSPSNSASNAPTVGQLPDRHQALRLENNAAIKAAALALAEARGLGNFTVEELAEAANVSRRTFFNHFGSIHEATRGALRDILLTASEDVLRYFAGQTMAEPPQTMAQLFELTAAAIQEVDVTETIRSSCRVLGQSPRENPLHSAWFREVFDAITADFEILLEQLVPHIPALSRTLMVRLMLTSVEVCAEEWSVTALELPPAEGLARWRQLHGQAMDQLRTGFGA